jgi:hypothetical protein
MNSISVFWRGMQQIHRHEARGVEGIRSNSVDAYSSGKGIHRRNEKVLTTILDGTNLPAHNVHDPKLDESNLPAQSLNHGLILKTFDIALRLSCSKEMLSLFVVQLFCRRS